jgi:outer membrane murein-binding lipoprotein Lpp
MTDGQIDQIYNLIHALNDRIADLERETAELRFRVYNAENGLDRLNWRIDHD